MATQPDPTRGRSRRRGRCLGLWLVLLAVTGLGGDRGWAPPPVPAARVGAQTPDCAASTVATGQLPPAGGLFATGVFEANYSSPAPKIR